MARTFFGVLGALMVVAFAVFAVAFGLNQHTALPTVLRSVALVVAGVLLALGGLVPRDRLGSTRPRQLIGAGVLVFGVATVAGSVLEAFESGTPAASGDLLFLLTDGLLGVVFTVMGVEYVRGGRHFDVAALE